MSWLLLCLPGIGFYLIQLADLVGLYAGRQPDIVDADRIVLGPGSMRTRLFLEPAWGFLVFHEFLQMHLEAGVQVNVPSIDGYSRCV